MPFNTRNPIPSGDLRDLDDNARNIDTWANDKTKLSHPDRFGVQRRTWHGIEQEAKLNIQQAIDAKNAAQEAAMMSGFSKYADTLAQLEAGIGADYVDGDVVMVFQDESRGDTSSIFKVESGVAEFKLTFDKTRQDLLSFTGTISEDAEWSDVPAHSDPAFDAQALALANRTAYIMSQAAVGVDSIADLLEVARRTPGVTVDVRGYHAKGDGGGGRFYWASDIAKSKHNGGTVIDPDRAFPDWGDLGESVAWYSGAGHSGVGAWVRVIEDATPTMWMFGVRATIDFDVVIAATNRKALETMVRDTVYSTFRLPAKNMPVWVLGSIHPMRSNIKIIHEKGCFLKGRYDAPGVFVPQGGHLWGFALYRNPDLETPDYEITGVVSGVYYQLDGDIATIYNDSHSWKNNNNPIGFYASRGCQVIGSGGVSESDHHGINFDGQSTDVVIDVAYVRNTAHYPVIVKGAYAGATIMTHRGYAKINVGSISGVLFSVLSVRNYVDVRDQEYAEVHIGSLSGNTTLLGNAASAQGCGRVKLLGGRITEVQCLVNQYETQHAVVEDVDTSNVRVFIRRGGTNAGKHKTVTMRRVTGAGSANAVVYQDDAPLSTFKALNVEDCDFSAITGTVTPYGPSIISAGRPDILNFAGNNTPSTWVDNPNIWNKRKDIQAYVDPNSTSFTINVAGANGDRPFTRIVGHIVQATNLYQYEIDLYLLSLTSLTQRIPLKHASGADMLVTAQRSGLTVNVSLDAGATGSVFRQYRLCN